jgi:hypothetical protein
VLYWKRYSAKRLDKRPEHSGLRKRPGCNPDKERRDERKGSLVKNKTGVDEPLTFGRSQHHSSVARVGTVTLPGC